MTCSSAANSLKLPMREAHFPWESASHSHVTPPTALLPAPSKPQPTGCLPNSNHTHLSAAPQTNSNPGDLRRGSGSTRLYDTEAPNNLFLATSAMTVAAGCLILRSAEIT